MNTNKKYVVAFDSTHHAINAEKILKGKNLDIRMIPTPREISASCGLSIKFNEDDLESIMKTMETILGEKKILINGMFVIEKKDREIIVDKIME